MNTIRGLVAVFMAKVLAWGCAAGQALPTLIWMRVGLVVVSASILAGGTVRSAVAALPPAARNE